MTPPIPERAGRRPLHALLRILLAVALVVVVNRAMYALGLTLEFDLSADSGINRMVLMVALLYALCLAVPFVPGVEIGLAMMAALGLPVVPLVYLSTVLGLLLGFAIGRLLPLDLLVRLCHDLHLRRAEALMARFAALPADQRFAFLTSAAPDNLLGTLLRHRYPMLALIINLPGNIVIGGGGGIAMMAGASRMFSLAGFVLTVMLAVAPVPLLIYLTEPYFMHR